MFGFSYRYHTGVHYFTLPLLGFVLALNEDGTGRFFIYGKGHAVEFASPFSSPGALLGAPYQPDVNLGYNSAAWYANAVHELIHIWYSWRYKGKLSPNHAFLAGILSDDDVPLWQRDREEEVVTSFQVYANRQGMPWNGLRQVMDVAHQPAAAYGDCKRFHDWVIQCVLSRQDSN